MKHYLIVIALLITSCGTPEERMPPLKEPKGVEYGHVEVSPELKPEFLHFLAECEERKNQRCLEHLKILRSVKYVDRFLPYPSVAEDSVALCHFRYFQTDLFYARIEVLKRIKPNTFRMRSVMFHELGHCLLGLKHSETDRTDLMYPSSVSPSMASPESWKQAVDEMFQRPEDLYMLFLE